LIVVVVVVIGGVVGDSGELTAVEKGLKVVGGKQDVKINGRVARMND
jgi:hypothetical protein